MVLPQLSDLDSGYTCGCRDCDCDIRVSEDGKICHWCELDEHSLVPLFDTGESPLGDYKEIER